MHVKIFSGRPEEVQGWVNEWLGAHKHITICDRLQSQSEDSQTHGGPVTVLTITIFYDN